MVMIVLLLLRILRWYFIMDFDVEMFRKIGVIEFDIHFFLLQAYGLKFIINVEGQARKFSLKNTVIKIEIYSIYLSHVMNLISKA